MSTLRNRFTGEVINDDEIELLNLHPNLEETAIEIEPEIAETTPFITTAETIAEEELIAGAAQAETPWGLGIIALAGITFIAAESGQWLYKHFHKTTQPQTRETAKQLTQHLKTLKQDLKNLNERNTQYQKEINTVQTNLGADFDETKYRAYKLSEIRHVIDNINKLQLDKYTPTQREDITKSIKRIQHQFQIADTESNTHFKNNADRDKQLNEWSSTALTKRKLLRNKHKNGKITNNTI